MMVVRTSTMASKVSPWQQRPSHRLRDDGPPATHKASPPYPNVGNSAITPGLRDARPNGLRGVQRGLPPHEAAFVGVPQVGRLAADEEMGCFRGIGEALVFDRQ